jgi:hypothetical protein
MGRSFESAPRLRPAARPPRPPQERQPLRRFPGRPPLRRPHPLRRHLPPAGHEERPLPPAWRQEYRRADRRGLSPRPDRPPRPRPPHRRRHRPAFRRFRRQPSPGLDDRPRPRLRAGACFNSRPNPRFAAQARALRWAWGASLGFDSAAGWAGRRGGAESPCRGGRQPPVCPAIDRQSFWRRWIRLEVSQRLPPRAWTFA